MNLRVIGRRLLYTAAALILLAVVLVLGLRLALQRVPRYQDDIKAWVHRQTGLYIRFTQVSPTLRWYGPELHFDRLELRSKDDRRTLLRAAGGSIALDVWRLLANGKLLAGRISIDTPEIELLRLGPSRFALASELVLNRNAGDAMPDLDDLPAGRLIIRNAQFTMRNWNAALPLLILRSLDLDLRRDYDNAVFSVEAVMPTKLAGSIDIRGAAHNLAQSKNLEWSLGAQVRGASIAGWRLLFADVGAGVMAGTAQADLSVQGRGSELTAADGRATAQQVTLDPGLGGPRTYNEIGAILGLRRSGEDWILTGKRVRARAPGRPDIETQFSARWQSDSAGIKQLQLQANVLPLDTFAPLGGAFSAKSVAQKIAGYRPGGEWVGPYFSFTRGIAGARAQWRARGQFKDLSFASLDSIPGFRGLSGSLSGDERSGRLQLDSTGAQFLWPNQFPQPVDLKVLRASIFWTRTEAGMLVASQDLSLANQDAAAQAKLAWQQFDDQRPAQIILVASVDNANAAAASRYLPRQLIAPKALDWLDRAFIAGRVAHGDLLLRGPIKHFPFRDGSGIFSVKFPAQGMIIDYREGWPRIEDLAVDAHFLNQGLNVTIKHARTRDVIVHAGSAEFPDFKTGELTIHAATHGDAAAALDFVRATPVDAMAENGFSAVNASGPMDAQVDLFLPFKQFEQRTVRVHAHLDNVDISHPASKISATEVAGDVDVDGAQVRRAQVHGHLLGRNFQMRARTPGRGDLATRLDLRGAASGEALRAAFDLPASLMAGGATDWRASIRLAPSPARERRVRIASSLAGLDVRLPAPLAKETAAAMPVSFEAEWPRAGVSILRIAVDPVGRAVFTMDKNDTGMHGSVLLGGGNPPPNDAAGLIVAGKVRRLDLSAWLNLRPADKSGASSFIQLRQINLDVGELNYRGLAFRDVGAVVSADARIWRVDLSGPNTQGQILVPVLAGDPLPWELQFSQLKFSDGPKDTVRGPAINVREIPALNFRVLQLKWGDRPLGAVDLRVSKLTDGISVDRLSVESPSFRLDAHGGWRGSGAGRGDLIGAVSSTDVQSTLTQLGYADVMQAKSGLLEFNLDWTGEPSSEAVAHMNGHVRMAVEKGQLVGLKPGAGRMLGLASIATLPRRLSLDFSDLTDKGLAFDSIHGDFQIVAGNAYTDNLLLHGPAADIGLVGRAGLATRDYDQTAVVTGSFGNSLPVAGALAGGPVVGAALLVFSQVFKGPLKGLARGYYRITGGWDSPTIERVTSGEAAAAEHRAPAAEDPQ